MTLAPAAALAAGRCEVEGRLGALRAAPLADAPAAALFEGSCSSGWGWRWCPATSASPAGWRRGGCFLPGLAQRVRRQRVVQAFGVGGVAADAGDADELVDLVVVGLEVVVADRPVVGHTVEGAAPGSPRAAAVATPHRSRSSCLRRR